MNRRQKLAFILFLTAGIALPGATTRGIGVVMSDGGSILINDARTAGNATIFDGSVLQTQDGISQVRLNDGAQVRFAADTRGKIFADHVDMEKGSARISSATISGFAANANGLSVRAGGDTTATVSMLPGRTVEVAALTGNVHVFNAAGINVANLLAGDALNLRPDAGAAAPAGPSKLVGCAVKVGAVLLMTDETSNVTLQLRGGNVRPGRRIQITGTRLTNATATKPATQVMNVTNVKEVSGACKAGTAAALAGASAAGGAAGAAGAAAGAAGGAAGAAGVAGAAAGAAAAGIGTTTAVVGGVAAAAAVAGGAVAATSGSSPSSSQLGGNGTGQVSGSGSSAANR